MTSDFTTQIKAIGPKRLYLLAIMRGMGLSPLPNLVTASAKSIASVAEMSEHTVSGHLDGLLSMRYVGMANSRAWYLTANGMLVTPPAEMSMVDISASQPHLLPKPEMSMTDISGLAANPSNPAEMSTVDISRPEMFAVDISAQEIEIDLNLKSREREICDSLRKNHVFSNLAKKHASEIAAEPAYWPHLVAHIAFANSGECDHDKPGAYLHGVIKSRDLGPIDYQPPEGLSFSQMLDWATLGETTADYYARIAPVVQLPMPAQNPAQPAAFPVVSDATPATPAARPVPPVWQAAQAVLKMEMPEHTYRLWVAPTGIEEMGDGAYLVICHSAAAREWLGRQLAPAIRRALAHVTGAPVAELEFTTP